MALCTTQAFVQNGNGQPARPVTSPSEILQPSPVHSRVVTGAVCRAILDKKVNVLGLLLELGAVVVGCGKPMRGMCATTYDRPRETLPKQRSGGYAFVSGPLLRWLIYF